MNHTSKPRSTSLSETLLGGDFLQCRAQAERNPNLLARTLPLTEWLDQRYAAGLDPYSKATLGPVHTTAVAALRKGEPIHPTCVINLASQDYLNLSAHPHVRAAAVHAIATYGVHSAGSPALMGNTGASLRLERALAEFTGYPDVSLFPTGWAAGYGAVRALVTPKDYVIIDRLAHACLMEGTRASTQKVIVVPHLDVDSVKRELDQIRSKDAESGILVVTESLFSMDSDSPDLRQMQASCHQHNATLLVDCAHDLGAMGEKGLGALEAQDMIGRIDVMMGSFSKTFASNGGFVASHHPGLKLALRYGCGPQTFSNALSAVQCATVLAALEIVRSDEGRERRNAVMRNSIYLRDGLKTLGYTCVGDPSPVVPVVVGEMGLARLLCRQVLERGALVNMVEFPGVPRTGSRFRLQVMAEHTQTQLDQFLQLLGESQQLATAEWEDYKRHLPTQSELVAQGQ